jgi:O-antigen/teichoic acid export membrane protein
MYHLGIQQMSASFKIGTIKNIGYNAVARFITFSLQTVANIILAHNLASDDYGLVGMALIFINFMGQFNDFGIGAAVIQKKELLGKDLYTGFTIKFILGIVVFCFSIVLAPTSQLLFDNNNIINIIRVLSINFVIDGLSFLPNSQLTRQLQYKKLAILQIASGLVYSTVAILLALNGFKFWSLVAANICSALTTVLVVNAVEPIKIRFCFDKKVAVEFFNFGKHLVFSGLTIFLVLNSDNFLIGAVLGSTMLGYYALAFNWGTLTCNILDSVINSVIFPTLCRMQNDSLRIIQVYLKVIHYIAFFAIISNLSLFLISKEFLFSILGNGSNKWLPALTAFRILCVYGIIRAMLVPVGSVITALGHTNLILKSNIIVGVLQLSFLYPVVRYFGIEGAASMVLLSYLTQYIVFFPALKKLIDLKYSEVLQSIKYPLIAAILPIALIWGMTDINIFQNTWQHLWIKLFISISSYFLMYGIISRWAIIKETKSIIAGMRAG